MVAVGRTSQRGRHRRPGLFFALAATSVLVLMVALGTLWRPGAAAPSLRITPSQASIITELVSVFQNDSALVQYGFIEQRFDGAGIVAGRDGFSSAGGELLQVVRSYAAQRPDTPLAAFEPSLAALAAAHSDDVTGLAELETAWRQAAGDPALRAAQDQVDEQLYYTPSLRRARGLGLRSALGLAIVYDTAVQHGFGSGPDGLDALISAATATVHGDPAGGVAESTWSGRYSTPARPTSATRPTAGGRRRGAHRKAGRSPSDACSAPATTP